MNLDVSDLKVLGEVAIKAAKEAGAFISSKAGSNVSYQKKETGTSLAAQVVTEVDRMSQDIVLNVLLPICTEYDIGILAEESEDDLSRFEKDYFWCIDPMDGTLPFIESRPGYAVSIGLVSRDGAPLIGVVYDPLEQVLYHAIKGVGVYRQQKPWKIDVSQSEDSEEIDRGGAVMNACWVLENPPAYYFKNPKSEDGGGCLWDYAATACLFETMGAWVSDAQGNPLELNRRDSFFMNHRGILFASNETIAKEIIQRNKG